jgi:hypothetical protein
MRYHEFNLTEDDLFEISMSPTSLKKLSSGTGALAGMEFEMIVPNTEGNDDGDMEPDYDSDERCRSIQDAYDFFYDGDFNGRRDVDSLRDRMQNDFQEWLDDKIYRDWQSGGEEYLEEWIPNNVDESEWNPDSLEGDERQEALEEFIANMHANPGSSDAFDEFREENFESYDESDWLDDEDLDLMSAIENSYEISWPHWRSTGGGETSIEDVADSFQEAIGRKVQASGSYHSGRVDRPSTKSLHYIVEPDGSLSPDDSNDQGLEFVSPPLPIDELLSDLNKVKAWADRTGCYTNDSTGLHINVSVPGWSGGNEKLDYVKLALLLGDKHVLESFGRMGNTYCKSAVDIVQKRVKQNPDAAKNLLDQMRGQLNQMATKAIHSGSTEKYTSINTKDGYIEFRSPGGDWLNNNFAEIEGTLRRFSVALTAAVDPEMYRKEYLKKLYKMLDVGGEKDPLTHFARYAAGELPKAALKSFIRQAQLEREVNRGKDTGPMWWRVYKEGKNAANGAIIEVVASSKQEALDKASKEWRVFSDQDQRTMYAEPVRPYKQEGRLVTLTGRPSNPDGDYVIVNNETMEPAYRFMASDANDSLTVLRQWISANPGTTWNIKHDPDKQLGQPGQQSQAASASTTASHPEGRGRPHDPNGRYAIVSREDPAAYQTGRGTEPEYLFRFDMGNPAEQHNGRYILAAWAARNNVDPANYMVVDAERWNTPAGAVPGSTQDLQRQRLVAQMPALNTADGNWEIYSIASNNTVYRFVADTEEEAVRAFNIWQDTIRAPSLSREGFNLRTTTEAAPRIQPQSARGTESLPPGNARWLILDRNDQEVYSFINTTAQSDANQYARNWMINTAPAEVRDRGPFNIVPAR